LPLSWPGRFVAAALAFSSDLAAILALSSLLTAGNPFGHAAEFALIPAVGGSRPVTEATGIVEAARYAGLAAGPVLAAGLAALGARCLSTPRASWRSRPLWMQCAPAARPARGRHASSRARSTAFASSAATASCV
jgi:hypothetical protein